jgi:hypothetical protein
MATTKFTVENDCAERLLNYLIAYKKLMIKDNIEKESNGKELTMSMIHPYEPAQIS